MVYKMLEAIESKKIMHYKYYKQRIASWGHGVIVIFFRGRLLLQFNGTWVKVRKDCSL